MRKHRFAEAEPREAVRAIYRWVLRGFEQEEDGSVPPWDATSGYYGWFVAIRPHGSRDGAIVRITRYGLDVVAPRRMSRTELLGRLDAAGIVFNENHRPARWAPWRPVTGVALDGRLEAAPLLDLALKAHRALDSAP